MKKTIVIRGLIIPTAWDDSHNTIEISLSTCGERDYKIEMDSMGKSLKKLESKQVKVEAVFQNEKKNDESIKVYAYEVLDWS